MKHITNGIVALLFLTAVCSCSDDIEVGRPIDNDAYAPIYEVNAILNDAATNRPVNIVELYGQSEQVTLKLNFSGRPEGRPAASAAVDADYVAVYNAQHGTSYAPYPQEAVRFENEGAFLFGESGEPAPLAVTIDAHESLQAGVTYLLPVAVRIPGDAVTLRSEESRCFYLVRDMRTLPTCDKGEGLPKGICFIETGDTNPLNVLSFELENGKLLWDAVVLFSANINYDREAQRCYISCNKSVRYLLDNNETFIQPLRNRGIKVLLGLLGNGDEAGLSRLADHTARDFAAEIARYCKTYNLDGVNFDDEYSGLADYTNLAFTGENGRAAAGRLCYETKRAMPDKLISVFLWASMFGHPEIDGVSASEWIDLAIRDYNQTFSHDWPRSIIGNEKRALISMEYRRNHGGSLTESVARAMLSDGYGWFMGFGPTPVDRGVPVFYKAFDRLKGGPGILYGSQLKAPTVFYKVNDPKPYRYPEDVTE